jgi:hypothetical protein
MAGQTLTQEADQAVMILYGTLRNARLANPNTDGFGMGETELVLDKKNGVIKEHSFVAGKDVVILPKYLPADRNDKFLIFCDLFKGKLDPYRGMPTKPDSDMGKYLKGALAVKKEKTSERLRFFFNYLQNDDIEVANDSLKEFGNATYEEFKAIAPSLDADKVAQWLTSKDTPGYRVGLYASILGHSSRKPDEHAKLLRSLVDNPENRVGSGVDGILAGQVLLQPKEGWAYLRAVLGNRKHDFNYRYAALKAARFFADFRKDVISKDDLVEAVQQMLDHPDIADLAIEDMRRWKVWDQTKRILGLKDRAAYDLPVMRRSILRFMLSSPLGEAKKYVEEVRKQDEELVISAEEVLRVEQALPPPDGRAPGSN